MLADSPERERIIKAAYRCFAESNGGSVSVNDILSAAGLSTRAFYRHFGSKDGLLLAMFRRDSENLLAELQSAVASAASPTEALRHWIVVMLRLTCDVRRRQRVRVMTSDEALRAVGYAAERARFMAAQDAAIAQILYRGRQEGYFPTADPEPDARAIRAMISRAFEEQMADTASVSAAGAAAEVVDFAFRALGAKDSGSKGSEASAMGKPPAPLPSGPV